MLRLPSITGLATTAVLTPVENKIPEVNNLVKKQIMIQKYQILNLNILLDYKSSSTSNKSWIKSRTIQNNKIRCIWFNLSSRQKSYRRWWYSKLFSILANA